MRRVILFIVVFILFIGCSFERPLDYQSREREGVVTGLANATEVDISSKVAGRIIATHVQEGDMVERGALLVELSVDELNAKLDQAQSAIEAVNAQLRMATKGARPEEKKAAKEQVEAAREQVKIAEKMYQRMLNLMDQGALAQAKFDEAEFKYNVAQRQLEMAQAQYSAIMSGARKEEIQALEAMVSKGKNTAAEVEIYLKEAKQKAPISGEVSSVILHAGELANAGYPLVTIVDLDDVWGSFAVREDKLVSIKKGDVYKVFIPALGASYEMYVNHLAVLGDFANWRATSERDHFDLKSFEVKLKPVEKIVGLRPGMTMRWDLNQAPVGHHQTLDKKAVVVDDFSGNGDVESL